MGKVKRKKKRKEQNILKCKEDSARLLKYSKLERSFWEEFREYGGCMNYEELMKQRNVFFDVNGWI